MPFQPGQSGNPSGRPKESNEAKKLARVHGPKAIEKLAALLDDGDARVVTSAAIALLDRGYGKPAQALTGGDADDNPLEVNMNHRLVELVRP